MRKDLYHRSLAILLLAMFSIQPVAARAPLQDFEGNPSSIDQFAGDGKWTVVMIWASDCEICNREAHQYERFHTEHSDHDSRILGVSADGWDGRADARAFIERHQVTFPNLIGNPHEIAAWFTELTGAGWIGTPTFMIYDPQGELKAQQIGAVPVPLIEDYIRSHSQ